PDLMREFAINGRSRGIKVIIAAAGGAAHLPGMTASYTTLPVIGVPIPSKNLNGLDSLLSIVQMPYGIPVATVAIGGAKNAALLAVRILSLESDELRLKLEEFASKMREDVISTTL
ncbi:MAG: 5-(carboxyamino)imidazole ribonucleotide mutase, partial [Thermoplasmatales archaeon]